MLMRPARRRGKHISRRRVADALKLVFVFDGAPPALKAPEVAKRRAVKQRYEAETFVSEPATPAPYTQYDRFFSIPTSPMHSTWSSGSPTFAASFDFFAMSVSLAETA